MNISELTYLNNSLLNFYYKDFNIKEHYKIKGKLALEISLANGPKIEQTIEKEEIEFDSLDKLYALWDFLISNSKISHHRPQNLNYGEKEESEFMFEELVAHKLFFPKSALTEISGLDQLIVWVGEPEEVLLSTEEWNFSGTFLILIQSLYDNEKFAQTLSGCSALQAISNLISGKQFYTKNWDEPYGRHSHEHPIQKLEKMGAIYLQKQKIKTIYRKRYMTDEQCFTFKNKKYRCNDLLGYPLFIS